MVVCRLFGACCLSFLGLLCVASRLLLVDWLCVVCRSLFVCCCCLLLVGRRCFSVFVVRCLRFGGWLCVAC